VPCEADEGRIAELHELRRRLDTFEARYQAELAELPGADFALKTEVSRRHALTLPLRETLRRLEVVNRAV